MKISFNHPQELIKRRFSCRSYQPLALSTHHQKELRSFIGKLNKGNLPILQLFTRKINFELICGLNKKRIDSFRFFKNSNNLIFAAINPQLPFSYEIYGYLMEMLVLKATELDIYSCWLGYFEHSLLLNYHAKDKIIPSIVILGYPPNKNTYRDKIIRFVINANNRKPWEKLFFNNDFQQPILKDLKHPYYQPLEYLRLAPSCGNTQPWRIIVNKNQNAFHFYKESISKAYEKKKLHHIDLGIAMSHFDIGLVESNIKGRWERLSVPPVDPLSNMEYIISWIKIS